MIFRSDMKVDLIDFMGGDDRVVQAARVSTKGSASREDTAGTGGLIRYLMREGHHVPFEHSVFTFYIEAPIFVTRQILKHRISSISETSGRYRELEGQFYVPADERPLVQVEVAQRPLQLLKNLSVVQPQTHRVLVPIVEQHLKSVL